MAKEKDPLATRPYIVRRGNTYYFRKRIPEDVLWQFPTGEKEIKISLRTGDAKLAAVRADIELRKALVEFERRRRANARSSSGRPKQEVFTLDDELIQKICATYCKQLLEDDDELRIDLLVRRKSPQEMHGEADQRTLELLRGVLSGAEPLDILEAPRDAALSLLGLRLSPSVSDLDLDRMSVRFAAALIQAYETKLRRNRGEVVSVEAVLGARPLLPNQGSERSGQHGGLYEQIFDKWVAKDGGKKPTKTVESYRHTWKSLRKFMGGKSLPQVDEVDIQNFKDELFKTSEYRTVKKKVGQIKTLFRVAKTYKLLADNPAADVVVPRPKVGVPKREDYDTNDLNLIFSSALYTKRQRPIGGGGEAAVWLLPIGLFSGARQAEIGQLRIADIIRVDDIWAFDFTDEEKDSKAVDSPSPRLKNDGSRRQVPIHPKLIDMGFLDYVEYQKKRGSRLLFPDLKPSKTNGITGNWSKWWGRYAREQIGITSRHRVFHSTRHAFKSEARDDLVRIPKELSDQITGHQRKEAADNYGEYRMKRLLEEVKKISYPGVNFPNKIFVASTG